MRGGIYVLNFYSPVFVDQLKRGRKTATIRLGDKSNKYERGQVVWITVGFATAPAKNIHRGHRRFEVERGPRISPRDIEHDNPEFRQLRRRRSSSSNRSTGKPVDARRIGHGDPLLADRRAARRPLRQWRDAAPQLIRRPLARARRGRVRFLTTWLLESPRQPVWDAIHDQARWPRWWRGVERRRNSAGRAQRGLGSVSRLVWRSLLPIGSPSR